MTTASRQRKSTAKTNSPVKKTGQSGIVKKRLIKLPQETQISGREKVLAAARSCFARQGFAGTSIADIQKESGFSRGNLYHHFKTKEEIIQIIITKNLGRFCDHIESVLNELAERDLRLPQIIRELAHLAEQITNGPGKGMAFHVWSLAMVDTDVRLTMTQCFERIRSNLEQKIQLLMDKGKIAKTKNVQQLSVALFGLVIPAFTLQSVFMDDKAIDAQTYTKALELLFK